MEGKTEADVSSSPGMEVVSTNTVSTWDVVLTIDENGDMAWAVPDEPVFYWEYDSGNWIGRLLE